MHAENHLYPETMEFYENYNLEDTLTSYLKLISDCKRFLEIPVIASINCISPYNWTYFARSLQDAGADALELNIFVLPSNIDNTGLDNEKTYYEIIKNVQKEVSIPISIKISHYFSNLGGMIQNLSNTGIDGMVLFNRFYSPDIDIDNLEVISSHIFSEPTEYVMPLHWIGLTSSRVKCDISASTGVHDAQTMIKMILAGAKTVQVATTLYKNGISHIRTMLNELESYMDNKNYKTLNDFRGILSQSAANNPAGYLRVQFMKHFANK